MHIMNYISNYKYGYKHVYFFEYFPVMNLVSHFSPDRTGKW